MRRRFAVTVWLISTVLLAVGNLDVEAQAARVSITVLDMEGRPLEGVTVIITCWEKEGWEEVRTTNKKGKIAVTHVDSMKTYSYRMEMEGYQTQITQIRPDYSETTRRSIVLPPVDPVARGEADPAEDSRGGRAVTLFKEGTEAQQRGDLDLAEKKFRQAAEFNPDAAEPHIALAVVSHQRGDYGTAATEAEKALAISPENEQALLLRHDAYRMLGDEEKTTQSAEALRQAGITSSAAGTLFTEGMTDYRGGNTEDAVEKFRQAIELDPTLINGYLMLGNIALIEGNLEEAWVLSEKALELNPGDGNALKIRYDAARRLGDEAASKDALDALIAADPEWASTDLFNHAVELYNADDMANAATVLAKVVELRPDDAKALFLLGMTEINLGRTTAASEHLTKYLELAPDDPDAAIAREMLSFASQ
jgi:tetratricopeptide (TPR) repeat protein